MIGLDLGTLKTGRWPKIYKKNCGHVAAQKAGKELLGHDKFQLWMFII